VIQVTYLLCEIGHNAPKNGKRPSASGRGERPQPAIMIHVGGAVMIFSGKVLFAASILVLGVVGGAPAQTGTLPQSEAARAYYAAAVQGSADAQANLADIYARGEDVAQSDVAAFQWFMRAANQGHAKAQVRLADIWANGRGVPRHDSFAYKWAYLAKLNATNAETRDAADRLWRRLAERLSDEEIAEAQQRASEWRRELEISPTAPAETVTTTPPAPKPQIKEKPQYRQKARPTAVAKSAPSRLQGKRMRAATSGRFEKVGISPRFLRLARKLGW
jgi:Sel1 repeat